MSREMMKILLELAGLIEDVNRAIAIANERAGMDSSDTDQIRWAIEGLQTDIYRLARGSV